MTELSVVCPVCGAVSHQGEVSCAHVQFIYSYHQGRFLFLSCELAEAIARADAQQVGCRDENWRSLPELAQLLLEEREQVVLLKWQKRQPSWEGWLVGIDAQAEVQSFNLIPKFNSDASLLCDSVKLNSTAKNDAKEAFSEF